MQKKFTLILLMIFSVVLVACQNASTDSDSTSKETLTLAWGEDFGDVNPHRYNPDQFVIQDMVYEGLVKYGKGGKIEPALAESWTISDDGKTYTFKLRDATYSDGSKFTAENVERNFKSIFSKENIGNHNWFGFTNQLDKYKVIDEQTFELTLKEPYSATLYDLAMIRPIRFLADSAFPKGDDTTKNNVKAPIGTGQWIVAEKKSNAFITFKRNDNYWGEKPKLKEVTVKIIPDGQTRALEFEAGNLDLIYGNGLISLETFSQYADNEDYVTDISEPMSTRLLLLNAKSDVFKDQMVRQALNHAINKTAIAEDLFRGTERPADTIFSKSTPYVTTDFTPYTYDLSKAQSLLEEAGWAKNADGLLEKDGKQLTLNMPYIATKSTDKDLGEYFQGELKKIGVDINLTAMEEDDYWSNAKTGNFDLMLTYSWGAPWDPHAWMSALTSKAANGHPENISLESLAIKPKLDQIVKETLVETDIQKVEDGYKEVLTMLHEEAIYIPLTYQSVISVYRKGELEGVDFAAEENAFPLQSISKTEK